MWTISKEGKMEDKENNTVLIFDDSSEDRILTSLGITINYEQNLVDIDGKILTNSDHETINLKEFGGFL